MLSASIVRSPAHASPVRIPQRPCRCQTSRHCNGAGTERQGPDGRCARWANRRPLYAMPRRRSNPELESPPETPETGSRAKGPAVRPAKGTALVRWIGHSISQTLDILPHFCYIAVFHSCGPQLEAASHVPRSVSSPSLLRWSDNTQTLRAVYRSSSGSLLLSHSGHAHGLH
jgi:hypothetical protein